MIDFFVSNYKLVVSCIMAVVSAVSVILAAIRRFRFFRLKDFFSYLAYLVAGVESVIGSGNGDVKLSVVLESAKKWLISHHLDLSDDEIIYYIESFLDTPSRNDK